jgi:pantoate--beta-alanine ligase
LQTIRQLPALRAAISALKRDGGRIAFVPTMGALHKGHLTLVREARRRADHVVASIFVNPTQFGPNEDLDAYPRREAEDAALLAGEGVALLWAPDADTMYPPGHATRVNVAGLDTVLCGAARPGHFDGVATVVSKLFNQVDPELALFGEKDWQQLAIIRRMAADCDFALEIEGVPTVREADGLAMSSRNAYLSPDQRKSAAALPRALSQASMAIASGADVAAALGSARAMLLDSGFGSVDYLDLRNEVSLEETAVFQPDARLFAAARIGTTRLIDNLGAGQTIPGADQG